MGKVISIAEWQKRIGEWGKRKGWDMSKARAKGDRRRDFLLGKLMLVVTEVSEAAECVRDDDFGMNVAVSDGGTVGKPEGMLSELADAVIRIMHICDAMGLDLDTAIRVKMAYNEQRPYKHGRKA